MRTGRGTECKKLDARCARGALKRYHDTPCCLQFPCSCSTSRASLTALREHILKAVRLAELNIHFKVEFVDPLDESGTYLY